MRTEWVAWLDNVQKSSVLDAITHTEPRRAIDNGAGERRVPMKSQSHSYDDRPYTNRTPVDIRPHAEQCSASVQWTK